MAYNKITSHFSSSQTFSTDKYFSWNNSTNQGEFVDFIDFQDNTTNITASLNNLFITGNIKHKNNITSSLARLENDSTLYFGGHNNFIKNINNKISLFSDNSIELTGSIVGQNIIASNGITGSLVNVDNNNNKLIVGVSGMTVTVENESTTGLERFVLSPSNNSINNTGVTYLHYLESNIKKSLVCTGSDTVSYYLQNENTNLFNTLNINNTNTYNIDFNRATSEHKNYMMKGKVHIFYYNETLLPRPTRLNGVLKLPNNLFKIGTKLIFICGKYLPDIVLPDNDYVINSFNRQQQNELTVATRSAGTSYVLKKITNNKWSLTSGL